MDSAEHGQSTYGALASGSFLLEDWQWPWDTAGHMKNMKIDWFNSLFLTVLPLSSVVGLWIYFATETFNPWLLLLFVVFYILTGLSITAGYHRLFAHKAYQAHPWVEWFFLLFGAAAFENSALRWCEDHRVHHRFIDQDDDPYNIRRGFWFAHMGWVMQKRGPKDFSQFSRDLARNHRVAFQHKYYFPLGVIVGGVLPIGIGALMGSALGGLVFGVLLRVTVVHHFTFFINSMAHWWGAQPYSDKDSSKDNGLLAFFTYGEGYHNFHHRFHNDYRNGVKWYHFDPSKWTIRGMALVGLASQLKRTPKLQILEARLQMQHKQTKEKLLHLPDLHLAEHLENLRLSLTETFTKWVALRDQYKAAYRDFKTKKTAESYRNLQQLKLDLRLAKLAYKQRYSEWKLTIHHFGQLQPA